MDQRQSGGRGGQTITLKQIIGRCGVYNGAVKGLPFHSTMTFVRARLRVRAQCNLYVERQAFNIGTKGRC